MFQTKRLPVTLFSHSDAGAPVLEKKPGSLVSLLRACLVNGYGSKAGLGWEVPFEEGNDVVFRSKAADSNRHYLRVADSQNNRHAVVNVFTNMTGVQTGSGNFSYTNDYDRFAYIHSDDSVPLWYLVGHKKAFVLILSARDYSALLYFGDFPSMAAADTGNTLFFHNMSNYEYFSVRYFGSDSYGNGGKMPKRYNGVEQSVKVSFSSLGFAYAGGIYPDPICQGLSAAEIYIEELLESNNNQYAMRGLLPGVFKVRQGLQGFQEGAEFALEGSKDKWLKFCFSSSSGASYSFLVNATAWES